jgi:hypothetical protein
VGSSKKNKNKIINLYNLPETKGQHKTSQNAQILSGIKRNSRWPKMFGHKWKISSTFIRCPKLSGPIKKFPKCPKLLSMSSLQECPNVLGRNLKFSTFIIFPGRL